MLGNQKRFEKELSDKFSDLLINELYLIFSLDMNEFFLSLTKL